MIKDTYSIRAYHWDIFHRHDALRWYNRWRPSQTNTRWGGLSGASDRAQIKWTPPKYRNRKTDSTAEGESEGAREGERKRDLLWVSDRSPGLSWHAAIRKTRETYPRQQANNRLHSPSLPIKREAREDRGKKGPNNTCYCTPWGWANSSQSLQLGSQDLLVGAYLKPPQHSPCPHEAQTSSADSAELRWFDASRLHIQVHTITIDFTSCWFIFHDGHHQHRGDEVDGDSLIPMSKMAPKNKAWLLCQI